MENKDMPAFPQTMAECNGGITEIVDFNPCSVGLTKLEFFACNAPVDIPSWFVHVKPDLKVTEKPSWFKVEPKSDQEHIKQWLTDSENELPDRLLWFKVQWEKHEEEDRAFRCADMAARYFQWRRYYAEQLLLELSKTQP
jgi:hypothetical protein